MSVGVASAEVEVGDCGGPGPSSRRGRTLALSTWRMFYAIDNTCPHSGSAREGDWRPFRNLSLAPCRWTSRPANATTRGRITATLAIEAARVVQL